MVGDHVVIRHVDNGFSINVNEYGEKTRRASYVAKNVNELVAVIRSKVFPEELIATPDVRRDMVED